MTTGGVSFWRLIREAIWHGHHLVIAAGAACLSWIVAEMLGKDPDIIEAGWVFFCMLGILFHRENLTETYRDRQAVSNHPSSNEADLRNLGDHIRGEWLRIATKTLFLFSGLISLALTPRVEETVEAIRAVSVVFLMTGVALLDIDAVLDRIARRDLLRFLIQEINARPLGLSTEERLDRAIEASREMYHDTLGEFSIVVPTLEMIREYGHAPEGVDVADLLRHIEDYLSTLRETHALIRSFDPSAGGPARQHRSTEGATDGE